MNYRAIAKELYALRIEMLTERWARGQITADDDVELMIIAISNDLEEMNWAGTYA